MRAQRFLANVAIAFLPAAAVGATFNTWIKATLFNPVSVAVAFIVGGFVITDRMTKMFKTHQGPGQAGQGGDHV